MAWSRAILALSCCSGAVAVVHRPSVADGFAQFVVGGLPMPAVSRGLVVRTETDFAKVVMTTLSDVMDGERGKRAQKEWKAQAYGRPDVSFMGMQPVTEWKAVTKNPLSFVSPSYPSGCFTMAKRADTLACKSNLQRGSGVDKINLVHGDMLDATAKFVLSIEVYSFFLHKKETIQCAVCGKVCKGNFMDRPFSVQMPPCPILPGTWSLSIPLLSASEMKQDLLAPVPKFEMTYKVAIQHFTGIKLVEAEALLDA